MQTLNVSRFRVGACVAATLAGLMSAGIADRAYAAWPADKPIRFVVPFAAG